MIEDQGPSLILLHIIRHEKLHKKIIKQLTLPNKKDLLVVPEVILHSASVPSSNKFT